MIGAVVVTVVAAALAGFSTPQLPQLPNRSPKRGGTYGFFQEGEFSMSWRTVWSAYYKKDSDFEAFMNYFIAEACTPPQKLAVEALPYDLFVCAETCAEGEVPVLAVSADGKRSRHCSRVPA